MNKNEYDLLCEKIDYHMDRYYNQDSPKTVSYTHLHTFERIRHFLICLRNRYVTFTLINPRKKRRYRSLLTKKTMDREKNRINDFCYQL